MQSFNSRNPYTLEQLALFSIADEKEIDAVLTSAYSSILPWKNTPISNKAKKIMVLANLIQTNHEALARLATIEMGKTFLEAKLEVLKCITACEYYAIHAEGMLATSIVLHSDGRKVHTLFEPLGTVLGIFPWNFPYWQIIRSAIPIVMGGNTMIVKPAPNTPQCALALQSLFDKAGLGEGVIQTLFVNEQQIAQIIADTRINACTLTGSEKAGSSVASQAASCIKKSVLELGGSDPFIVCKDADLDLVMRNVIAARFQNNGQSCIASKRYIIHHSIYEEFLSGLIEKVKELKMGDPMLAETNIGPLARLDLKEKLALQVDETLKQGATLMYQAQFDELNTCFYPPTILGNIVKNSTAYAQELFGPVISLFQFNEDNEAISLANDTDFGLGASIWSRDRNNAAKIALSIESGQVFINAVTRSNAAFPFGGIKKSGFGREMGEHGLKEFCSVKTIWD